MKHFELVHSDLWGPAPITAINGMRYFLLFIDDFRRFTWFYLLKTKDKTYSTFLKKVLLKLNLKLKSNLFK